jgi:hypothetical protein
MKKLYPLRIVAIIIAIITTLAAVLGLIYYISPTTTIRLISHLPSSWQDTLFTDFLLRGGTGFWVFLAVSILLWWVIPKIRY